MKLFTAIRYVVLRTLYYKLFLVLRRLHTSQVAHQAGAYPGILSMK